jgi:hypothetical protein
MKKGQVAIFIIVGLFFVGAIILFVWLKSANPVIVEEKECSIDSDCVPNECCDADLCVPNTNATAPECGQATPWAADDIVCPPGCGSFFGNFLGCMSNPDWPRRCKCINEKCAPERS